jgi:hypothetical protein
VAVVDRHRLHRRVREHETDGGRAFEIELVDDGHEIVAVRAEPVHPDHARGGRRPRLDFYRFK